MQKTTELDSLTFAAMLRQGAVQLGRNKKVINDLNVFPIPDGDTGDNMLMTLKAGCTALNDQLGTLSEITSAASSGMLLGARGNSGVILSRIFAGLAKGLQGVIEADTKAFAKAMQSAVEEAYKSVPVPVEGTIITVLREGVANADASSDLNHYFETLLEAMQASLDHTPELLQVLKDAGVVDSGGAGLVSIFRGMNDALNGIISEEEIAPTSAATPTVELDKFTEDSTLEFGYCTEFLLRLMRSKVDLDTFDEKEILFLTIKIENMSLQHHQSTNQNNASFKLPPKPYGIVTVASGDGLVQAFHEIGADEVIAGGQTMNPSTQDFLDAFARINAQHILVFPNNKNIKLAADQAAEFYKDADIHVLPSTTIGEGYYGIGYIDRDNPNVDEIIASVTEIMQSVVTGMVSAAIRDAEGDQVSVHTGDYVGYSGKQILSASPDRETATKELIDHLGAASRDVMLVFYGEQVSQNEAEKLVADLPTQYKNLEIMLNNGEQPVYDYIIVCI